MGFRQKLGLDPTSTKELTTFLGGKDELKGELFLNMRSDIRTREQANAIMFFTMVGHPDLFNGDVARVVRDQLLTMSIGFQGKRAELIAAVMSRGNIQNEKQTNKYDFSRSESKDQNL